MTRDQANAALAKLRALRDDADAKRVEAINAARRVIPMLVRRGDLFREWTALDMLAAPWGTGPRGHMARKAGLILREIGVLQSKGSKDRPAFMLIRLS
jgi:hypothetical protein